MLVTESMKVDLLWWINNLASQNRCTDHGNPQIVITSDVSLRRWVPFMKMKHLEADGQNLRLKIISMF